MKPNKFYGAALTSFVIWGFIALPLRALSAYPSGQILYFRILLSVLILTAITLLFRRSSIKETYQVYQGAPPGGKRKFLLLTGLGGILLAINWFVFIYAINHINLQTGSFSYLICPILTALLAYFILKEKLKVNQWLAIGISILSCCLIGTASITNLLFSLAIALSYAFYLITQRVLKQYDKMLLLNLQLIVTFILIGPFYQYFNAGHEIGVDPYFFGMIALVSVLFTIVPLFLNLYALKELKSGTLGILLYINPIINFLIAFLYFGEKMTTQQGIAYSLIFLSVVVYNISLKKKQKKKHLAPVI